MLLASLPLLGVAAFVFAVGTAVGSFLNVVIHRVPRGESIVRPRSRCPRCQQALPAWANVPLVSYAILRGRCRTCGAPISMRYPAVEALTGLLFLALVLWLPPGVRVLVSCALAAVLVAVAFIDFEHQIIPNAITLPGIPAGLLCAWLWPPPILSDALLGLVLAGGLMWAISAGYEWRTGRVGLGLGDVKLVAMLGSFLGLQAALGIMVLGSLLALVQALSLMALGRAGRKTRIPFGPALAIAGIAHLFRPDLFALVVSTLPAFPG